MQLTHLKNQELEQSFYQVVKSERKIMHLVILHIQEISRRKYYLAKGFSSLFDYLVNELKYSAAAAQRRIEAAKLMNEVPVISEKLQTGEINLSQIGDIQRAVKNAEKIHQAKVSPDRKAKLVSQVLNQSTSYTQQACAEALNIPVVEAQKITTQKNKSKRIETTLTEEQFLLFEKVRDLLAHKHLQKRRTQDFGDVLQTICEHIIEKSHLAKENSSESISVSEMELLSSTSISEMDMVNRSALNANASEVSVSEMKLNNSSASKASKSGISASEMNLASTSEFKMENDSAVWKSLTPKRKKAILKQDQFCQYENPETGKMCQSTFNLQVDHILPKSRGGANGPGNLRVLCREHNLFRNMA